MVQINYCSYYCNGGTIDLDALWKFSFFMEPININGLDQEMTSPAYGMMDQDIVLVL